MEMLQMIVLLIAAFLLGSCPFSFLVGKKIIRKDIRDYGDGNPGAINVFRAGGSRAGCVAVFLDVSKGIPFVHIAYATYNLSGIAIAAISLSVIAGNAFSPFLHFKGGKSIAVTFGTLIGMIPQVELLVLFIIFILVGVFFFSNNAWTVITAPTGSLIYLQVTAAPYWQTVFVAAVLILLAIKHRHELKNKPRVKLRVLEWIRSSI